LELDNTGDCTKPVSCPSGLVSDNLIVPSKYKNTAWDPTGIAPGATSEILRTNPYISNADGKPWFKCDCTKEDGKINLPADPYKCSTDICTNISISDGLSSGDRVFCDCTGSGEAAIPEGAATGQCFNPKSATECGSVNSWDKDTQQCKCNEGYPIYCENKTYGLTGDRIKDADGNVSTFKCPTSKTGRMCYDICKTNNCSGNGKCTGKRTRTDDGFDYIDYKCLCNNPGKDDKTQWSGKDCDQKCYTEGVQVGTVHTSRYCTDSQCVTHYKCKEDLPGLKKSQCCSGDWDNNCKCKAADN
jgi:hypothetical protein